MFCLYSILVQSLNLCVGYGGMLSLCHAAFYGLGAYISSLLMMNLGFPFAAALPTAVILTGILAWLVSFPTTRLRGDFFVLATLGFQMIVFAVLHNWTKVTGGPQGVSGVPRPSLFGVNISTPAALLLLVLFATTLCCCLIWWLTNSPYGRTLQAVREDEIAAASVGKDVYAFKRSAFMWTGAIAAVPGVLYATYSSYIDPTGFSLDESIFILCMLIIGGAGNIRGPFIGAVVLTFLPELLRFLNMPDDIAANLRQILYGLAIVVMMRVRSQGVAGRYAFDL